MWPVHGWAILQPVSSIKQVVGGCNRNDSSREETKKTKKKTIFHPNFPSKGLNLTIYIK